MKRFFIPLLALLAAPVLLSNLNPGPLPLGASLPMADRALPDVSGKSITLAEARGNNGVLVMFSCNTCPYVVKNEERITQMQDLAAKLGFGMIILNSNEAYRENEDSPKAMKEYAAEKQIYTYYVVDKDSEVADAFGAKRTPECFLFDKFLKLVYHGAIDDNPNDAAAVVRRHLYEAMSELSQGKDVSVKETRSVGCSIKRKPKP